MYICKKIKTDIMENFTDILISEGYETFGLSLIFPGQNAWAKEENKRLLSNPEQLIFIEGDENSNNSTFLFRKSKNDFSTMKVGGIHVQYIKNGDFKNRFIWGFNEMGKPPTLIHPRPKIKVKRINHKTKKIEVINEIFDDAMSLCLSLESHCDVLKAIRESTSFYYDTTLKNID